MKRRGLYILTIFAVLFGLFSISFSHPLENKKAPYIALQDGYGKLYQLDEIIKEANLLILTFFSKDCIECRKETEAFNRISRRYKDQKVVIIWILVGENEKKTKKLKEEWGIEFTVLADKFGEAAMDYIIGNQFPQTFFIDKNGIIKGWKAGGLIEKEIEEKIKEFLK
jgi:peroxiredoxin